MLSVLISGAWPGFQNTIGLGTIAIFVGGLLALAFLSRRQRQAADATKDLADALRGELDVAKGKIERLELENEKLRADRETDRLKIADLERKTDFTQFDSNLARAVSALESHEVAAAGRAAETAARDERLLALIETIASRKLNP